LIGYHELKLCALRQCVGRGAVRLVQQRKPVKHGITENRLLPQLVNQPGLKR
jgi:hypothetical protein